MINVEFCEHGEHCNSCDGTGHVNIRVKPETTGGLTFTLCQECAIELGTVLYHL